MDNSFRTFFLMTLLTVLFVFVGGFVGGTHGAFVAFLFAGALAMLGQFARYSGDRSRRQNPLGMILILVGAPLAGMVIRSMISRTKEYAADAGGAEISRKPLWLATALEKISVAARKIPLTRGDPAHSHLFIVNPFLGLNGLQRLFSTHPPIEERIRRLEQMARSRQN